MWCAMIHINFTKIFFHITSLVWDEIRYKNDVPADKIICIIFITRQWTTFQSNVLLSLSFAEIMTFLINGEHNEDTLCE